MNASAVKYHFIRSSNSHRSLSIQVSEVKSYKVEKSLGAHVDYKPTFENHIKTLCRQAG